MNKALDEQEELPEVECTPETCDEGCYDTQQPEECKHDWLLKALQSRPILHKKPLGWTLYQCSKCGKEEKVTEQPEEPTLWELPKQLHEWYLEATTKLNPNSFNQDAQKPYDELSEEQKYIDQYIADKLKSKLLELAEELRMEEAEYAPHQMFLSGYNAAVEEANQRLDTFISKLK